MERETLETEQQRKERNWLKGKSKCVKGRIEGDEKRLILHPQRCRELVQKELSECIEFIEWTAECEMCRNDNYLCFSWLVIDMPPSFHSLSVRSDCNELRPCWIMTDKSNQYWGVGWKKKREKWIFTTLNLWNDSKDLYLWKTEDDQVFISPFEAPEPRSSVFTVS